MIARAGFFITLMLGVFVLPIELFPVTRTYGRTYRWALTVLAGLLGTAVIDLYVAVVIVVGDVFQEAIQGAPLFLSMLWLNVLYFAAIFVFFWLLRRTNLRQRSGIRRRRWAGACRIGCRWGSARRSRSKNLPPRRRFAGGAHRRRSGCGRRAAGQEGMQQGCRMAARLAQPPRFAARFRRRVAARPVRFVQGRALQRSRRRRVAFRSECRRPSARFSHIFGITPGCHARRRARPVWFGFVPLRRGLRKTLRVHGSCLP